MSVKGETLIQVENLEKAFGKTKVLKGITTEIHKGEVVVIIGPSGSGKSTFLRSLNLLEKPTGGKIFFEGTDITDPKVNIDNHRQKIGMVFQHFNLFPHKTILENITLAPVTLGKLSSSEADAKAKELLNRVGLLDKANTYPEQLSGGQKQRIAIDLMKDLAKDGMTMVVVTHEMGFAREVGTRVMFIDEGIIKEENSPKQFFDEPKDSRLQDFLRKVL